MKPIRVRSARPDELQWINAQYDTVGFVHSDLSREVLAVAESGDERAGLGRLVDLGDGDAELGGMFVGESFRRRGVAEEVVGFLIAQSSAYKRIFCLPFAHLAGFYKKHGFAPCPEGMEIPDEIRKKHTWCGQQYEQKTLLYVLTR